MVTANPLAPLFRQSVGFDRFNDVFESTLHSETALGQPPHNVERYGDDHYRIVIAAAGLSADDLDLQLEKDTLIVCGRAGHNDAGATYLYQGIAHGAFRMVFHLADRIEVQGATFENGLLMIFLLRVPPAEETPRHIRIDRSDDDARSRRINRS